jgi:hypothetical protein
MHLRAVVEERGKSLPTNSTRVMHSGSTTTTMTGRMTVFSLLNESMGMWLECG